MVTGVTYGASVAINTTVNGEDSSSDNLLAVKAKLAVSAMGISASVNFGYSNEEVRKASELDTTSSLIVLGGTADLRGKVQRTKSAQDISNLFQTAGTDFAPIN